jgi:hypothetical protein
MSDYLFPTLTAEDIECRVAQVTQNKRGVSASLLLYKDARVDMRLLDEKIGPRNWMRRHTLIAGNLFCTISIWDAEKGQWIEKEDVGTESNTEKEKGQASDAFKRAAFNVGIGRELYTAPRISVTLRDDEYENDEKAKKPKVFPWTKFSVLDVGYNERREIVKLAIADMKGEVRFKWDISAPAKSPKPAAEPKPTTMPSVSDDPEVNRLRGMILDELKQNLALADKAAKARYKKNFYDLALPELQEVALKVGAA